MLIKKCSKCSKTKSIEEFHKDTRPWLKDNHIAACKECRSVYRKEHYKKNKKKSNAQSQLWYANNKVKYLASLQDKRATPEGWAKSTLRVIRKRAKDKNIAFSITVNDILPPSYCPIFGIKLQIHKRAPGDDSPSVDRIIPKLGYTAENIVVISSRANRIKDNATLQELEKITKWLRKQITKRKVSK